MADQRVGQLFLTIAATIPDVIPNAIKMLRQIQMIQRQRRRLLF